MLDKNLNQTEEHNARKEEQSSPEEHNLEPIKITMDKKHKWYVSLPWPEYTCFSFLFWHAIDEIPIFESIGNNIWKIDTENSLAFYKLYDVNFETNIVMLSLISAF